MPVWTSNEGSTGWLTEKEMKIEKGGRAEKLNWVQAEAWDHHYNLISGKSRCRVSEVRSTVLSWLAGDDVDPMRRMSMVDHVFRRRGVTKDPERRRPLSPLSRSRRSGAMAARLNGRLGLRLSSLQVSTRGRWLGHNPANQIRHRWMRFVADRLDEDLTRRFQVAPLSDPVGCDEFRTGSMPLPQVHLHGHFLLRIRVSSERFHGFQTPKLRLSFTSNYVVFNGSRRKTFFRGAEIWNSNPGGSRPLILRMFLHVLGGGLRNWSVPFPPLDGSSGLGTRLKLVYGAMAGHFVCFVYCQMGSCPNLQQPLSYCLFLCIFCELQLKVFL